VVFHADLTAATAGAVKFTAVAVTCQLWLWWGVGGRVVSGVRGCRIGETEGDMCESSE
jgi:hypothetical protein